MDALEKRFSINRNMDLDVDVGGLGVVALSASADENLIRNIYASILAFQMGNRSVDHMRKRYSYAVPELSDNDRPIRDLIRKSIYNQQRFYRNITPRDNAPLGIFAADMALVRSSEALLLTMYSARRGYLIETFALMRGLVEQLSYAVAVFGSDSDNLVFDTKPQSSISSLKRLFPKAGYAYGKLSEICHYDPKMHYNFLGFSDSDTAGMVITRSWKFKAASFAWLLVVLNIREVIFRHFYGAFPEAEGLMFDDTEVFLFFDEFFKEVDLPFVNEARHCFANVGLGV